MTSPYSLGTPQINIPGYRPPEDYSLGSNWGQPTGMDGAAGNGMRFAPINSTTQLGGLPQADSSGSWNWFDRTDANGIKSQGVLMPALGVASGAFNAWMGMKQYGLAKAQLAEGKQQFALNYDAQRTTTNAQLEDRQRARVASNGGAYQSVGDYMNTNGIKPR